MEFCEILWLIYIFIIACESVSWRLLKKDIITNGTNDYDITVFGGQTYSEIPG